jgi:glycosyltransferase involved in cell wall biosynthesis
MKIGIDARFLTHPQCGGYKTYTECLVSALAAVDTANEYILYVDRAPSSATALPDRPNFLIRVVRDHLPVAGMPWREQVSLSRRAAQDRLSVLHSPCLSAPLLVSCPLVVTIHDMIWRHPDAYRNGTARPLRRRLMDFYYLHAGLHAARRAAVILTVSQASKKDIVIDLGVPSDRVVVTHEAARDVFRRVNEAAPLEGARRKYRLPARFILAMGSPDPRKNIPGLLRAYSLMHADLRKQYPLVVMWNHPRFEETSKKETDRLGLSGQVISRRLGPLAEDFAMLLNAASTFVFPSLSEGFGLPPLEAMACGTPVVTSDNSSMPEVLGDAALRVDAQDAGGLARAIERVLSDDEMRAELTRKGLEQAARYSWEACARLTLRAYERAAGA